MCRILLHSPYNIENFVVGFQKNQNKVCNMSVSWNVCGLDSIQGNIFCFFLKYLQKKRKKKKSGPTLVRPLRQRVLICVCARAH